MLKVGATCIAEMASEQLLKKVIDSTPVPCHEVPDDQKEFERRIRITQNILGIICPPAGRAMVLLEYGPIVAAEGVKNAWESDAAKCLGRWIRNRF